MVASLAALLSLLTAAAASSPQIPLGANRHAIVESQQPGGRLNFSSSAPHLFASTYALLQQWPNTVFPNGHTVAACRIPAHTLLYHGRREKEEPPSPEWLALDVEMAYGIMGSTRDSWLRTYQTTRAVGCLYFDGESAALQGLGQLDTQMLLLFGNVSGPAVRRGWGLTDEYMRASGLCDWLLDRGLRGQGWGFEGIVRMNAGFEVIWCDFLSGSLRLLSNVNVTAPLLPDDEEEEEVGDEAGDEGEGGWEGRLDLRDAGGDGDGDGDDDDDDGGGEQVETSYYSLPPVPTRTDKATEPSNPPSPPNWRWQRDREPFLHAQGWGWFDSATWHYGSSRNGPGAGETRARVLSCGVLSYYAPRFTNQSLNRALDERKALNLTDDGLWMGEGPSANRTAALAQLARRRRYHHLEMVTPSEAALMRSSVETMVRTLLEDEGQCTGADWTLMTAEIVQRTTRLLKILEQQLASAPADPGNATAVRDWMDGLRSQLHMFMVSFLEYPPADDPGGWSTGSQLFNATLSLCRYRYTRLMAPAEHVTPLVPEEEDQRWAMEETFGSICQVLLGIGFEVEEAWVGKFGKARRGNRKNPTKKESLLRDPRAWHGRLEELIAWLGWESEFIGCKDVCNWDERCYIPMWPLLGVGRSRRPRGPPPRRNSTRPTRPEYPPYYGIPGHPPGNGTLPGPPRFRPPRGPSWMGDETDLWEPICVKAYYIMGER